MRVVMGTVGEDSGAFFVAELIGKEDGSGGGMQDLGACSEEEWKYDPWGSIVEVSVEDKFVVVPAPGSQAAIKPSPDAYTDALQHKVKEC